MRHLPPLLLAVSLCACASQPTRSGFLTSYDSMSPRSMVRAKAIHHRGGPELAKIRSVAIEPTTLHPSVEADWLTEEGKKALLREIDAQLCRKLSRRYPLTTPDRADARIRAAVTELGATGRGGSVVSATANHFIPGPIGVRPPGSTGGLSAEAEMLDREGRQLAAVSWSRDAMNIGADTPALTRIGDALQFAKPFAKAAAKAMRAPKTKKRKLEKPDPCAEYGPRFRPEGFLAKFATGLYVPQMSAAKPEKEAKPKRDAKSEKEPPK